MLGRDFTLSSMKEMGYESVFLAVGAPKGTGLGMKGDDAPGVTEAIDFLRQYNLTGKAPVGKNVVVVGGGNAAIDAARTALRLGAGSVTVAYRRTRAEMPAYREEVEEAEREGVKFQFLVAPVELAQEKGKLAAVQMRRMGLGDFDRSGRRKPVADPQSDFMMPADQLIAAVGQALQPNEIFNGVTLKLNDREFIAVNPVNGQASEEWVFAGGDAVSGPSSVIEAIAAGEKAAVGMHAFLSGKGEIPWRTPRMVDTFFDPDADPVMGARPGLKLIPVSRRKGFAEVETTWSAAVSMAETKRCLRCDYRE
jgi:NADH-quinone oxidoreductase subunit F